jgi:hypothetical protein
MWRMITGELIVKPKADVALTFDYPDVSAVEDPPSAPPQATLKWKADGGTAWFATHDLPADALPQQNRLTITLVSPRTQAPCAGTLHLGETLTIPVQLP